MFRTNLHLFSNKTLAGVIVSVSLVMIMCIACGIVLFSCKSVHKTFSKTKEKTDSSSITTIDSTGVTKSDSSASKIETEEYERETETTYEPVLQITQKNGKPDSSIIYLPKIKTKERGKIRKQETVHKNVSDSTGIKKANNTEVASTTIGIGSTIDREGSSWLIVFLQCLIPIALCAAIFYFLKYRRRKTAKPQ